jgi:hypothetical protein
MKNTKGLLIYLPVFITVIVLLFSFVINLSDVQGDMNPPNKSYESILIYTNDSLWEIADEYMNEDYYNYDSYISEVISINNIQGTTIYAGEELIIPIVE